MNQVHSFGFPYGDCHWMPCGKNIELLALSQALMAGFDITVTAVWGNTVVAGPWSGTIGG
jgi:hypothetical protein